MEQSRKRNNYWKGILLVANFTYLLIYNNIWIADNILTLQNQATTIPILKKQRSLKPYQSCKKELLSYISNTKIPYADLKRIINKFILKKWQNSWDDQTQNKLHIIHNWLTCFRRNRKELILSRPSPICSTCKVTLTIKHILINCDRFRQIHPKYYQSSTLKDLIHFHHYLFETL